MKAHLQNKDSEILWVKNIPTHWNMWKVKFVSFYQNGAAFKSDLFRNDGDVFVIRIGDLVGSKVSLDDATTITKENAEGFENVRLKKNDILLALTGATIGKSALFELDEECYLNQRVALFRPRKNISKEYLMLFIDSDVFRTHIDFECYGGAQENVGKSQILNAKLPLPPLPEQRQIAAYLDYKTNQIDRFIANRKKQIELLEEQKEAIINKAITVGVDNNDLEDIDTHWYSQKPKNWELLKFNAAINLIHGFQFRDNDFTAEGIKIVKITQLNANGTLDLTNADTIDEKRLSSFKSRIIKNGDILMALTGGTIGKIIRVEDLDEIVLQNYRVGKFEPRYKNQLSKRYLFWILRSEKTFAQINFLLRETGQPNIGKGDFSKMFFALPPTIEEQDVIADFIEKELAERNELISKYQKQIELMQEYKTSLISKAVTGKIDVREWQPKQTLKETV